MPYPGGKGADGVYQRIIRLMPPHRTYVEAFLGGGSVLEHKAPALSSIAIDADARAVDAWRRRLSSDPAMQPNARSTSVICGDALTWLPAYPWRGDEFVYCDPPYLMSTRSGRRIYAHEFSAEQHLKLLAVLACLPVPWILSGYRSAMYDDAAGVHGWQRQDFNSMTRGGLRSQSLWLNYTPGAARHDYRFLGENFRERERIKRKKARWAAKFAKLSPAERQGMLEVLQDLAPPEVARGDHASPEKAVQCSPELASPATAIGFRNG